MSDLTPNEIADANLYPYRLPLRDVLHIEDFARDFHSRPGETLRNPRSLRGTREKKMGIGNKVKEARKFAGMTQKQLADKVGLSRESITNYERGKFQVSINMLQQIADATNLPVSWFFRDGPE